MVPPTNPASSSVQHYVSQNLPSTNSAPFAAALAAAVPRSVLDGPRNVPQNVPHADVPLLPLSKLSDEQDKRDIESVAEPEVEEEYTGFLRSPRTQCHDLITEPSPVVEAIPGKPQFTASPAVDKAVRKLPQCVYSSSPMISKSYRPSTGQSSTEQTAESTVVLDSVSTVQNSTSTAETASTVIPAGRTHN